MGLFLFLLIQFLLCQFQRRSNHRIHIIILILAQSSAKDYLLLLVCQLLIFLIQCTILLIIHRIVRLITDLPLRTVFSADHRLRNIISVIILAKLKPLVLDDPRPRRLSIRIIHRRISLKIRFVQHFRLKAYRTILQSTQLIFKVSINRPCINNLIRQSAFCTLWRSQMRFRAVALRSITAARF